MSPAEEAPERIRVVIAEDHEQVRRALVDLIGRRPDMEVVGEAANGVEALERVELLCPDILLIDIRMPKMDGIKVLGVLRTRGIKTRVIVLSAHEDEAYVAEAMKRGADGFILKGLSLKSVVEAIVEVSRGKTFLSPEITRPLIKLFSLADSGMAGISRVLEHGHTAEDLVQNCLDEIREYFHADFGCLYRTPLAHPTGGRDIFLSSCRLDPLEDERAILNAWLPVVEQDLERLLEVADDSKPLVLNNYHLHSRGEQAGGRPMNVALIPVTNFGGNWGVIICCSEKPFHSSMQGFRYVFSMAGQAGLLLENIRGRHLLDKAGERIDSMREAMADMAGRALAAGSPDEALRAAALAAGLEAALVMAEEDEGGSLREIASWNIDPEGVSALMLDRLRAAAEEVRGSGRPATIEISERESEKVTQSKVRVTCLGVLLPLPGRVGPRVPLGDFLLSGSAEEAILVEPGISSVACETGGRDAGPAGLALLLLGRNEPMNPGGVAALEELLVEIRRLALNRQGRGARSGL